MARSRFLVDHDHLTTSRYDGPLDAAAASNRWDVLFVRPDGTSRLPYSSPAMDALIGQGGALGCVMCSDGLGRFLAAAYPRGRAPSPREASPILRAAGCDNLVARRGSWEGLGRRDMLRLLLAMLPAIDRPYARVASCVTGDLLVHVGNAAVGTPEMTAGGHLAEVHAIRIGVDEGCVVRAEVKSFTNTSLAEQVRYSRWRDVSSYPHYVVQAGCLRRVSAAEEALYPDSVYFPRKRHGAKRSAMEAFGLYDDGFEQSKVRVLGELAETFDRCYAGIAEMRFERCPAIGSARLGDELAFNAAAWVDDVDVVAADGDGARVAELLLSSLGCMGVRASAADKPRPGRPVLRVVREARFYENSETSDPYIDPRAQMDFGVPVQHVTVETFGRTLGSYVAAVERAGEGAAPKAPASLRCAVKELAIKRDCLDGKIRLAGTGPWTCFAVPVYDRAEGEPMFHLESMSLLHVGPDGSIRYERVEAGNSRAARSVDAAAIEPHAMAMAAERPEAFCMDRSGNLLAIVPTGMSALPDSPADVLRVFRHDGERSIKPNRYKPMYSSMIDIVVADDGRGGFLYSVGEFQNLGRSIARFPTIRRVAAVSGSANPEAFLPLIDVGFVRLNRPSALPFPIKYVREVAAMRGDALYGPGGRE